MRRSKYIRPIKGLLSILFMVTTVAGDNGPFEIDGSSPKTCTASTFTYSSEMAMATGSFDIDPGTYGMGKLGQKWTFTVSPGIVLDSDTWGDDGEHIGKYIVQNADGSYTFTVPSDGSWLAGMLTGVANAPGCDPNHPVEASAVTSSASIVVSQGQRSSNSISHSLSSSNVGSSAGGPPSQLSASTNHRSSSVASDSVSSFINSLSRSHATYTGTALSTSAVVGSSSHISTERAPASSSPSNGVSGSGFSAFPGPSNIQSTQTSQASYINPNPLGCSTIIPSEQNPILYSTVTGLSCVCQGTTLPLRPTVSNCEYQTLPPTLQAQTTASTAISQNTFVSLTTLLSSQSSPIGATTASFVGAGSGSSVQNSGGSGSSLIAGLSSFALLGSSSLGSLSSSSVLNTASIITSSSPQTPLSKGSSFDASSSIFKSSLFGSSGSALSGSRFASSGSFSSPITTSPSSIAMSMIAASNSQVTLVTASTFGSSSYPGVSSAHYAPPASASMGTTSASLKTSSSGDLGYSSSNLPDTTSATSRPGLQTLSLTSPPYSVSSVRAMNSPSGSSGLASPGSSVSVTVSPSTTGPVTQSAYATSLTTPLGIMFSPSASLAASASGCPGTPQCVLVPKSFDDQCLDADWAYCYCSGSPAPLLTSWMGNIVVPNCDYSTIPPSQCPGTPVIPYVPTQSGVSIVQVDDRLVIHQKRAIPATSMSSASCAPNSGASPSFTLTISAILPCTTTPPNPTLIAMSASASASAAAVSAYLADPPQPCNSNYNPPFTAEQWEVQGVQEFWEMYYKNESHWQELGLMQTLIQDFSGGESGNSNNIACTVTDESACQMPDNCLDIKTGPETWLAPYQIQAWYVMAAMMSFSKLMNMIWQSLEWAAQDMNYYAGELGSKFVVQVKAASLWSKVFPILNTILTLLAIVFIAADPFVAITLAPIVAALVGLAAAFGLAADVDSFLATQDQAEVDLSQIYSDEAFSDGWIQTLQYNVNLMHDGIWDQGTYNGTTAPQLMSGGIYMNMSQALVTIDAPDAGVNLNSTDHQSTQSVPTDKLTNWYENLLVANLINNWYKNINNVYIVYVPYGQVQGLNYDASMESFTEDDCNTQWIGGTNWDSLKQWNDSVVASCEENGMAVLMNGGSSKMEPPSFYEVANFTYNGYSYQVQDMVTSSLNGFFEYGFNYNATDSFVANLLDPTVENLSNISQYLNLEPTSPGMYNLPVCILHDLGAVPNSLNGPWTKPQFPGYPSQQQPCPCMSDDAQIVIKGTTYYFRDFATNATVTEFNTLIQKDGNDGTTCYVSPKGIPDCNDSPGQPDCIIADGPD